MTSTSFKRLGLCIAAIIILIAFTTAATAFELSSFRPIGLFILLAYIWFVATKCKTIYPISKRAIGQLTITFLITALATLNQSKQMIRTIALGNGNQAKIIYRATDAHAVHTISFILTIGLFVLYLILKSRTKK